jgi:hypothetical protein
MQKGLSAWCSLLYKNLLLQNRHQFLLELVLHLLELHHFNTVTQGTKLLVYEAGTFGRQTIPKVGLF